MKKEEYEEMLNAEIIPLYKSAFFRIYNTLFLAGVGINILACLYCYFVPRIELDFLIFVPAVFLLYVAVYFMGKAFNHKGFTITYKPFKAIQKLQLQFIEYIYLPFFAVAFWGCAVLLIYYNYSK